MPKPNNCPQVSIQRPCYAMASTDGQTADITMYGEIVETQPIDWWTDEPIPGQYIIESEFRLAAGRALFGDHHPHGQSGRRCWRFHPDSQ